jgi:hypothetical protein
VSREDWGVSFGRREIIEMELGFNTDREKVMD